MTVEEVQKWQVLGDKIEPRQEQHDIYNKYYDLYRNVYKHLGDDMHELSLISGIEES